MRDHYNQYKFKPKTSTTVDDLVSDSKDGGRLSSQGAHRSPKTDLTNLFIEEMKQKEYAKAKKAIMSSYQKQVQELYMPKPSESKKAELE